MDEGSFRDFYWLNNKKMQTFSTTQAANLASIAAILVILLKAFGIVLETEQVTTFLAVGVLILSPIVSYINRWRKGDLTALGFRRENY